MVTMAVPRKPRFQHSYSKLDLVEKCPGAFQLRYIEKLPERPNVPRDRGKLIHEIAATYIKQLVANASAQDVPLMREIAGQWLKNQNYLAGSCYTEVMEMAETLAATFELDWAHVTGTERFFTVRVGGGYVFRGLMDLEVTEGPSATIVDWKTAWEIKGERDLRRDPQVRYYGLATILEKPEIESVRVILGYVRHGAYPYVEFTRQELEGVEDELVTAIEKLEGRADWPYTPGSFCGLCDYATLEQCPAMREALKTESHPILTQADAEHVASELIVLDRNRKDRLEQLRTWATTHGPVVSGDIEYGHHETVYKSRDPRTVAQMLTDAGVDPFLALKVDNKAAERTAKSLPGMMDRLDALTVVKTFTKFTRRNAGGEEDEE